MLKQKMAHMDLLPIQEELLTRSPKRCFLNGPPGTGKTATLILQASKWLRERHDVHVVSLWRKSLAVSFLIELQLKEAISSYFSETLATIPEICRHEFNFDNTGEEERAITLLESEKKGGALFVIIDEAGPGWFVGGSCKFNQFCDELVRRVPSVCVWAADVFDLRPESLDSVTLSTPLRSPAYVVEEVERSEELQSGLVHSYTNDKRDVVPHTIRRIMHYDTGHSGLEPRDCFDCGTQVAAILHELNVGKPDGRPCFQYRDVFVLCGPRDRDHMTLTNIGLAHGLRSRLIPVRVVESTDDEAVRDMALAVEDKVTVSDWNSVAGLTRAVVAVVCGGSLLDTTDKLRAVSRCIAQLILVGEN